MYKRLNKEKIKNSLTPGKVTVLYGPRQVGKTTLIKEIQKDLDIPSTFINADIRKNREAFESEDPDVIKSILGNNKFLIIDEAQRINNIGLVLKIIVDEIPDVTVLATGSSSFELANQIQEPLTGRNITFHLYPISFSEVLQTTTEFDLNTRLSELLIYGSYPDTLNLPTYREKEDYLRRLSRDYLYKDVLEIQEIRKASKLDKLLQLIAFQIGSEVSLSELSNSLDLDLTTVDRYLDLLEKSFVIFSLSGFSRNLRKEVTKSNKYYFYDLGIRNVLIDNFKGIADRDDVGHLWENFILLERMKHIYYSGVPSNRYFWRVYTGAEIDYVEERQTQLYGYEIKWGKKQPKVPKSWIETYDNASYEIINRDNYIPFISS